MTVRAVVYRGCRDVEVVGDFPEPTLSGAREAIVRVTKSAICGTDLHPYRGEIPGFGTGTVLGHEFTGIVLAAGDMVPVRPGEAALASDLIACGICAACARAEHYQCARASLFGYSTVVGEAVNGGQADLVKVPFADLLLTRRPDDVSEDAALFASDTLATAVAATQAARIGPGQSAVIVGAGTVGLLSAMCARLVGAARIVLSDPSPGRRMLAAELGFEAVKPEDLTGACERADSVIEAVGTDESLSDAITVAGPRATVAVVGAHHGTTTSFPVGHAFASELTIAFVVGDPIRLRSQVIALLRSGQLDPTAVISHRLSLDEAVRGYELFDQAIAA